MLRDLDRLTQKRFDLVVVGGGIYGLFAAWEACRRGLKVCLLEKGDFMGATSSNSLRIVHGGLRYLQHLDFVRMRESIRERRFLMTLAPEFIGALPFVVPTCGWGLRGPTVLKAAMILNDLISMDRNRGIQPQNRIPRGSLITKAECLSKIPGIALQPSLVGGAVWHDGVAWNTERVGFCIMKTCWKQGARFANYVSVRSITKNNGRVQGVEAECQLTGRSLAIHSSAVLNAAGPWVDEVLAQSGLSSAEPYFCGSKAFNLLTKPILKNHAAAIPFQENFRDSEEFLNKGVRHFFIIPWRGHSLIGTRHLPYSGDTANFKITSEDVQLFLNEINRAYPAAALKPVDIARVFGGLVPRRRDSQGDVQLQKSYNLIDHFAEQGIEGLISVVGVKWTTARDVAEKAVRLVLRKLRRKPGGKWPESNEDGELGQRNTSIERESCSSEEGSRNSLSQVASSIATDPMLGETLTPETNVLRAEVIHGIRFEMAQRLTDILFRRTTLGLCGKPNKETIDKCMEIMSRELNWNSHRQEEESKITEQEFSRILPFS